MTLNKKIVITGGAGFIGSQLGYHLHIHGWKVVLLDNLSAGYVDNLIINGELFGQFVAKDIRDKDLIKHLEETEIVFHLAGIAPLPVCQSFPHYAYDVNTAGTANVLEAARIAGVKRVIFSSTSAVYEGNETNPHSEKDHIAPNLIYAMTKQAAESICKGYAENYGMDIIIARFFNVYGPHQDFKRLSPPFTGYVARELVAGRVPVLFNQSNARRDYIHSSDVIEILCRMLESPRHYHAEVFNVGSGKGYSVPEIYAIIQKLTNSSVSATYKDPSSYWQQYESLSAQPYPLSPTRIEKEVYKESIADISKTSGEFNWEAKLSIELGLKTVVDHVKNN